jgi:hypothetical protein
MLSPKTGHFHGIPTIHMAGLLFKTKEKHIINRDWRFFFNIVHCSRNKQPLLKSDEEVPGASSGAASGAASGVASAQGAKGCTQAESQGGTK